MGEKSGALTNMIIAIVALVAILLIVHNAFPELTDTVMEKMTNIVEKATDYEINPELPEG